MNITGLNKAHVLQALYNGATRAIGFANDAGEQQMTTLEAEQEFQARPSGYFDYVRGRKLKVNLSKDIVDTFCYNSANGLGKAEREISKLKQGA